MVPSITETLFYLGLGDSVVGRTKFCIYPEDKIQSVQKIGGTKNINIELIKSLSPDLIIANKEENVKKDVEALSELYPTYVSEVLDWQTSLDMILNIGKLCHVQQASLKLVSQLKSAKTSYNYSDKGNALYLIWKDPFMSIGGDTFISEIMQLAGYQNVLQSNLRYPEVDIKSLIEKVDIVLLSSEPYPFKEQHRIALEEEFNKPFKLVDGELFSWYGSRMLKSFEYFHSL